MFGLDDDEYNVTGMRIEIQDLKSQLESLKKENHDLRNRLTVVMLERNELKNQGNDYSFEYHHGG